MENKNTIKIINNTLAKKIDKDVKLKFLNQSEILSEIACNYFVTFGMLSTALSDIKNACNKIDVYCLKSISTNNKWFDDDYFLKLFNEEIIFFDDIKGKLDENLNKYSRYIYKTKKVDFSDFIKNISI